MESIISDTNHEIDQKIKNKVLPTHDDKKRIQLRIKQLEKRQQLHLFNNIIKSLDIYTVTETGTYFDLNDLSPEQFWKLHWHINLTYDCINRNKVINELEKECNFLYSGELDIDSNSLWNDSFEPIEVDLDNIALGNNQINYSQLRDKALSQCRYSNHFKKDGESMTSKLTADHESKVIERNVYTDRRLAKTKK